MLVAMPSTPTVSRSSQFRRLRSGDSVLKNSWMPSMKYFCPDCHATFNVRASLMRHRALRECERKEQPAKQDTTKMIARKRIALSSSRHQSQLLMPGNVSMLRKPVKRRGHYVCPDCEKTYTFSTSLWRHRHYECGVDPRFCCTECDAKFAQKSNLTRHMKARHL